MRLTDATAFAELLERTNPNGTGNVLETNNKEAPKLLPGLSECADSSNGSHFLVMSHADDVHMINAGLEHEENGQMSSTSFVFDLENVYGFQADMN